MAYMECLGYLDLPRHGQWVSVASGTSGPGIDIEENHPATRQSASTRMNPTRRSTRLQVK